jgi:hypothetical protein
LQDSAAYLSGGLNRKQQVIIKIEKDEKNLVLNKLKL